MAISADRPVSPSQPFHPTCPTGITDIYPHNQLFLWGLGNLNSDKFAQQVLSPQSPEEKRLDLHFLCALSKCEFSIERLPLKLNAKIFEKSLFIIQFSWLGGEKIFYFFVQLWHS